MSGYKTVTVGEQEFVFTEEECREKDATEVLSWLIAHRDGHRHQMTIGEIIAKTNRLVEYFDERI